MTPDDDHRSPARPRQLSYAEQLMWRSDEGAATLPFLECPRHLALAVRISGPLDAAALRHTLADIARRHDALRSRFVAHHGPPICQSDPEWEPRLTVTDVGGSTPAVGPLDGPDHVRGRAFEQMLLHEEINAPFDLRAGGLLRARIFARDAAPSLLVVTVHHIVADGWSLRILARELETGYGCRALGRQPPWPPLSAGYADYVEWQQERLRSARAHDLAAAWAEDHAGAAATTIPGDLAPHGAVTPAATHAFTIGRDLVERLRGIAGAHRTTAGVAALASFVRLVAHESRRDNVVVGVPVWDRSRPAFEESMGLFMNALPIRVTVPPDATPADVLIETRDQFRRLSRFTSLPYLWLRDRQIDCGTPAAEPFRLVFNFAALDGVRIELPGVTTEPVDVLADTPAVADLSLHIFARGAALTGVILYKPEMYSLEFVESLASSYTRLLGSGRP